MKFSHDKRQQMATTFEAKSGQTNSDPNSPIEAAIPANVFESWIRKGEEGVEEVDAEIDIEFYQNFCGSGMSVLLLNCSQGFTYLLGGSCPPEKRNFGHCNGSNGVHGPWVTSSGTLVKIEFTKLKNSAREVLAAALAAWHPSIVQGSFKDVSESGVVTVETEPTEYTYSLRGNNRSSASIYMGEPTK